MLNRAAECELMGAPHNAMLAAMRREEGVRRRANRFVEGEHVIDDHHAASREKLPRKHEIEERA